jgi:hypothetical protein
VQPQRLRFFHPYRPSARRPRDHRAVVECGPLSNINWRPAVFGADDDKRAFGKPALYNAPIICPIDLSTKLMALARPSLGVFAGEVAAASELLPNADGLKVHAKQHRRAGPRTSLRGKFPANRELRSPRQPGENGLPADANATEMMLTVLRRLATVLGFSAASTSAQVTPGDPAGNQTIPEKDQSRPQDMPKGEKD